MFSAQQTERPGKNGFLFENVFLGLSGNGVKMERMGRKEIFQHEIKTGATIEEIKIYTNSLRLVFAVLSGKEYEIINHQHVYASHSILNELEKKELLTEIKELDKKIKLYEKKVKKI